MSNSLGRKMKTKLIESKNFVITNFSFILVEKHTSVEPLEIKSVQNKIREVSENSELI